MTIYVVRITCGLSAAIAYRVLKRYVHQIKELPAVTQLDAGKAGHYKDGRRLQGVYALYFGALTVGEVVQR